jgi:hypothetical protein
MSTSLHKNEEYIIRTQECSMKVKGCISEPKIEPQPENKFCQSPEISLSLHIFWTLLSPLASWAVLTKGISYLSLRDLHVMAILVITNPLQVTSRYFCITVPNLVRLAKLVYSCFSDCDWGTEFQNTPWTTKGPFLRISLELGKHHNTQWHSV